MEWLSDCSGSSQPAAGSHHAAGSNGRADTKLTDIFRSSRQIKNSGGLLRRALWTRPIFTYSTFYHTAAADTHQASFWQLPGADGALVHSPFKRWPQCAPCNPDRHPASGTVRACALVVTCSLPPYAMALPATKTLEQITSGSLSLTGKSAADPKMLLPPLPKLPARWVTSWRPC